MARNQVKLRGSQRGSRRRVSRRRFLRDAACTALALGGVGAFSSACAPSAAGTEGSASVPGRSARIGAPGTVPGSEAAFGAQVEWASETEWTQPEAHVGDLPRGEGSIQIPTVGTFKFDAGEVSTVRPDVFQAGHFSLFDVLVHLKERGDIDLDYHMDESANTHVIDALDGDNKWWYEAHYSNGWFESNVWRMDMYPFKNQTTVRMRVAREDRLEAIHTSFREEVERLARNGGQVILPELQVRSPAGEWNYEDVLVTPHNVRRDVLQPGQATALDALISLREQGRAEALGLTWHETIGYADPVDSYWVSRFNTAQAHGGCGFVYETGPLSFPGFSGTHIHIPADTRVLVSPEYALWFWICL